MLFGKQLTLKKTDLNLLIYILVMSPKCVFNVNSKNTIAIRTIILVFILYFSNSSNIIFLEL